MANYCTIAEVMDVGRLNVEGNTYDTTLASLIVACSRWIDAYCRVPDNGFAATESATRYYWPDDTDGPLLMLDEPLLSATAVTGGDGTTYAAGDYRLYPRNEPAKWKIVLAGGAVWGWSTDGEIAITGVWGHSSTVPAPVAEACRHLVSWMFKRYLAGLQDISGSVELGQVIYAESIPKQVKALLAPYKRVAL